jgi:hypothetical protein
MAALAGSPVAAASTAQQLGEVQAECELLAAQVAAIKALADIGTDVAERRKVAAEAESLQAALEVFTQQRDDALTSDLSEHGMASSSAAAAAAMAAGSSAVARAATYTAQQLGEVQVECESLAAQVAATKVVANTGTDAAEQRKVDADTESLQVSLEASTQQRDVLLSDLSEHGEPICSDGGGGGGRQPGSGGIHRTAAG